MWFPNTAFSFRISIRRSGITRRGVVASRGGAEGQRARNIMCLGSGGRRAASLRWPLLRSRGLTQRSLRWWGRGGITRRGGGAEGAEYNVRGERRALGDIAALAVATR